MVVSGSNNNGTGRRGPAHWSQLIAGRSIDNPRSRSTIRSSRMRIRDAIRRSRQIRARGGRIRGPLRWTTSRVRVHLNGELYVADTEDQSIGLDPAMLCPESEAQLVPDSEDKDLAVLCPESETQLCSDSEDKAIEDAALVVPETPEEEWPSFVMPEEATSEEELQDVVQEDLRLKHDSHRRLGNDCNGWRWRRALFDEDNHGSRHLGPEKGHKDEAMESVTKKVSKDLEFSISDAETDDEGVVPWDGNGSDVRGHSQMDDDGGHKDVVLRSNQMDEH